MAQGRMLNKRISKSKKFAALKNDRQRTLYMMTLPHLDCEGRIEGDPHIIKGQVCPYLNSHNLKSIENDLKALHQVGLILRYEIDGEVYIQVTQFDKFQSINKSREAASHIPPPTPEQLQTNSGVTPDELRVNISLNELKANIRARAEELFPKFWELYPKKRAKSKALESWMKLDFSNGLFDKITSSLKAQIKSEDWKRDRGQYVPHPATWLNQRRWEDETTPTAPLEIRHKCTSCQQELPFGEKGLCWQCEKQQMRARAAQ